MTNSNSGHEGRIWFWPGWVSILLFVGGTLVLFGILSFLFVFFQGSGGSASAGIVIFIGPFPLVFGAGPDAVWLILIGVLLAAVNLVVSVVLRKKLAFA